MGKKKANLASGKTRRSTRNNPLNLLHTNSEDEDEQLLHSEDEDSSKGSGPRGYETVWSMHDFELEPSLKSEDLSGEDNQSMEIITSDDDCDLGRMDGLTDEADAASAKLSKSFRKLTLKKGKAESESSSPPKRKRGRPKKKAISPKTPKTPAARKRGRPPKVKKELDKKRDEVPEKNKKHEPPEKTKGCPGRPAKREMIPLPGSCLEAAVATMKPQSECAVMNESCHPDEVTGYRPPAPDTDGCMFHLIYSVPQCTNSSYTNYLIPDTSADSSSGGMKLIAAFRCWKKPPPGVGTLTHPPGLNPENFNGLLSDHHGR
jgi:hypothetical protein